MALGYLGLETFLWRDLGLCVWRPFSDLCITSSFSYSGLVGFYFLLSFFYYSEM